MMWFVYSKFVMADLLMSPDMDEVLLCSDEYFVRDVSASVSCSFSLALNCVDVSFTSHYISKLIIIIIHSLLCLKSL